MGDVYLGFDPQTQREVAIKTRRGGSPERFVREASLMAALEHPGILRVFDAGVDPASGLAYYVCERVEGARDLRDVFRTLSLAERVELVRDAAEALGHAHQQGIVHRDLKPDNLLVDERGQVRVADFGLAGADDLERLTRTGALLGTPTHLAPEMWRAVEGSRTELDPRSDVWALGVVLYEALTSELPFEGESWIELRNRIVDSRPRPPSSVSPEVPRPLQAVCLRALARDPAGRPADGAALARELEAALRAGSGAPRFGAWGALALLALGLAFGVGVLLPAGPSPTPAPRVARAGPSSSAEAAPATAPASASPRPSASAPEEREAQLAVVEAQALRRAGRWAEAREVLARVLARSPRYAAAWRERGQLSGDRHELAAAIADLARAEELAPRDAEIAALHAVYLRQAGRLDAASAVVARARARGLAHAELSLVEASLAGYQDPARAQRIVDAVIEAQPNLAKAWTHRASLLLREGNRQAALAAIERAIELEPDFALGWQQRGRLLLGAGALDQALSDLRQAVSLAPANLNALTNLGAALIQKGLHSEALEVLERAKALHPGSRDVLLNRGHALRGLGRLADARDSFAAALELTPLDHPQHEPLRQTVDSLGAASNLDPVADPQGALREAARLQDAGQHDQALRLAETVLASNPRLAEAHYRTGNLLMHLRRAREALGPLNSAVELDPDTREHWNDRGLAHQALRDHARAIEDFTHVVERWPDHPQAWNNRAISRRQTGDPQGAVADCTRALELDAGYVEAYANRANALLNLRQPAKAEADVTRALELRPEVSLYGLRGAARQLARDWAGARADFQRFLSEAPPNDPRRGQVQERLRAVEAALAR